MGAHVGHNVEVEVVRGAADGDSTTLSAHAALRRSRGLPCSFLLTRAFATRLGDVGRADSTAALARAATQAEPRHDTQPVGERLIAQVPWKCESRPAELWVRDGSGHRGREREREREVTTVRSVRREGLVSHS